MSLFALPRELFNVTWVKNKDTGKLELPQDATPEQVAALAKYEAQIEASIRNKVKIEV